MIVLTGEIRLVVMQLDAPHLHRFRDDPPTLMAWANAADIRIRYRKGGPRPALLAFRSPDNGREGSASMVLDRPTPARQGAGPGLQTA